MPKHCILLLLIHALRTTDTQLLFVCLQVRQQLQTQCATLQTSIRSLRGQLTALQQRQAHGDNQTLRHLQVS